MDHRVITSRPLLRAAALGLLLGSLVPAPVRAQGGAPPDGADPIGAVTRPVQRPGGNMRAARTNVATENDGADDPESLPVAAYQRSLPAAPAADPGGLAISVVGKTGLVVALMLVCAAGWKRLRGAAPLGGLAPAQAVQVTSTVPLGPQRFLHLVTVGRQQLLVGSSPQNVALIAVLEGGSRCVSDPESGAAARGLPPQGAAPDDDAWAQGREAPADRFEELLLRLRDLESGPYPGEPAGSRTATGAEPGRREPEREASRGARDFTRDAVRAAVHPYVRGSEKGAGATLEAGWMGRAGGESAPPAPGGETGRPPVPGSLFRTSNGTGTGAPRRQEGIDA